MWLMGPSIPSACLVSSGHARASACGPPSGPCLLPCVRQCQSVQPKINCCAACAVLLLCPLFDNGHRPLLVAPPAPSGAPQRQGLRPHVFGMTASPLDAKLGQAAERVGAFFRELEANLDARVRRAT